MENFIFCAVHEYYTRSKDTVNADPPNFLSAHFKVESNLIKKYYYFKRQSNQSKGYNN